MIIDTTDLSGRQLRERIVGALGDDLRHATSSSLQVISFGYKYGMPLEADLVFDVRFMENPFYRARAADARRAGPSPCASSCSGQPITQRFLEYLREFFAFAVPAYQAEGKTPADRRHRLHRRLPPLGRDRGGAGGRLRALRHGTRRASGTASSSAHDADAAAATDDGRWPALAALAAAGDRHQALAAGRVPGRAAPGARRARSCMRHPLPRRRPRTASPASCSTSSSLQFLPDACARSLVRRRGRWSSSCTGCGGLLRVAARAVPGPTASRWSSWSTRSARWRAGPRIVAIGGGTGLSMLLRGPQGAHAATSPRW